MVKANAPAAAGSAPSTATAPASTASAPAHASSAPAAAAKPVPAKPVAKPAAQPATPVAEEDPWYMQTWAWGAGAGVLLLGLLAALRGRSRKAAPEAAAGASSLADRFGTVTPGGAAGADHDQEELLDQLAEHPDDIGLHLELVSLYYSRRDVDHFEAAAEAMHAHITDPQQPEWVDVVHMGENLVPEHPLFAHAIPSMHAHAGDEHEALDQFDLGSYAKEHEQDDDIDGMPPIPASPAPHAPKVSGYHFDFDLTPRHAQAAAGAPAASGHDEVQDDAHEAHAPTWHFAEPEGEEALDDKPLPHSHDLNHGFAHETADHDLGHDMGGQFSDDPVDTKLDLARAYLDMGDPDGAQAMLEEVLHEGTQMQKDVAKRLLETIR